jgi:hypothetical protein
MGEPMVANPNRAWLQQLRARIASDATVRGALDATAAAMGGKHVWTGSVADTWGAEVSGRKQRLGQLAQRLLSEVDGALARQPEQVTETEARSMRHDRAHDYYYS